MTQICPKCNKVVGDLRKHMMRNRCGLKGPMSEKAKAKQMKRAIRR